MAQKKSKFEHRLSKFKQYPSFGLLRPWTLFNCFYALRLRTHVSGLAAKKPVNQGKFDVMIKSNRFKSLPSSRCFGKWNDLPHGPSHSSRSPPLSQAAHQTLAIVSVTWVQSASLWFIAHCSADIAKLCKCSDLLSCKNLRLKHPKLVAFGHMKASTHKQTIINLKSENACQEI